MAVDIIVDAKLRRTGICGAAETLLIDARDADRLAAPLVEALKQRGCEIRGDEAIQKLVPDVNPASDADWSTEYLDTIISAGLVDGVRWGDPGTSTAGLPAIPRRSSPKTPAGGGAAS